MSPVTPRRVLLTADAVGGVWQYVIELAGGFAARGIEPIIATLGPDPSPRQRTTASQMATLIETGLPLDWIAESPRALHEAAGRLAGIAADASVDLVHLHAAAFAAREEWPAPVVSVAHSCVATWWRAVRGDALPEDFAWRAQMTADGLRRSAAVIAPSAAFAAMLRETYGIRRPIAVVRNGRRGPDPTTGLRELAVLTAGRLWDEAKNVAALDRAAALLRVPVYAAGPRRGPNAAEIRFARLRLLGNLDEAALRARFAGTAVFASPARYEPFGLGVLEAAQGGMALVLGDIPTFRELWNGAALFVDPSDHDALARTLGHLLDEPEEIARLGGLARERARSYPAEAMVEGTAGVHRSVLAGALTAAA